MNEQMIGQWILLGIVITLIAFDKVKAWQIKKNHPNNPGNYGERIAKLETKAENIEGDIKEIKDKIDNLIGG